MKKESTRDHLDLLLSSKYWPVVYAMDMACDVAHAELRNPLLTNVLWGDRRGCFERPKQHTPKVQIWSSVIYVVSCTFKTDKSQLQYK